MLEEEREGAGEGLGSKDRQQKIGNWGQAEAGVNRGGMGVAMKFQQGWFVVGTRVAGSVAVSNGAP